MMHLVDALVIFVCLVGFAMASHPAAAAANIATADMMLSHVKSLLRRDEGEGGLTTGQIVGISVGGGAFVIVTGWLIYKYKTWVPKTRAVRAGAVAGRPESPGSPSSAEERQKLIVAGASKPK
jgi:hypothetical protein